MLLIKILIWTVLTNFSLHYLWYWMSIFTISYRLSYLSIWISQQHLIFCAFNVANYLWEFFLNEVYVSITSSGTLSSFLSLSSTTSICFPLLSSSGCIPTVFQMAAVSTFPWSAMSSITPHYVGSNFTSSTIIFHIFGALSSLLDNSNNRLSNL